MSLELGGSLWNQGSTMRKGRLWKILGRRFLNLGKTAFDSPPGDASGRAPGDHRDGGLTIEFAESELERQYAAGHRDRSVDKYYQLLNRIEESIKAGRFDEAKKAASASMPLLGAVVNWARNTSASGAFDLQRIPAIDRAGKIAVAQSDLQTLQVMLREVNKHDDLKQWQQTLQAMIGDVEVVESILTTIRETPGYLQKDLKKSVTPHGARLGDLCQWMDKVGRIRRERSGKSYKLFEGSTSLA